MANNKLKHPFLISRNNQTRPIIGITDVLIGRALTVKGVEIPEGTSLEAALQDLNTRPYKTYKALLTQSGSSAPTAVVFENTIGAITWARTGAGVYTATLTGAFLAAKTAVTRVLDVIEGEVTVDGYVKAVRTNDNVITVTSDATDGKLSSTLFEINTFIVIEDISGN
jgi:sulfur carrier protein ThiS